MAKTKLHKIKLHPNRWLIWAIAYLLLVGMAMTGYLKVSNLNIDAENGASGVFMPAHTYVSSSLEFSLRYPSNWSIEANSGSSVTFLPAEGSDSGVTILVTDPAAEKSIRQSLKISSESQTVLGNELAATIINDLGQGHFETVVLAVHNHKLYVVSGSDNFVRKLLLTFRFLPNK